MLRQGSVLALRAMNLQQAGLSAAVSSMRGAAAELAAAETGASSISQVPVAAQQFSSAAAGALAAKKAYLGAGSSPLNIKAGKSFGTFASGGAIAAGASTGSATATAAAAQAEQPSILRRLVQAAATVAGAMMLAAGVASADSPEPWQWVFQDTASSTAQAMVDLHHDIMFFVITIVTVVLYMLGQIATKFHYARQLKPEKLTHHTTLEVVWTIIPTIIVLFIAVPSLTLIYSLDQHTDRPGLTVKVIGRQWYWSYEMHDHLQQKLLDPDRLVAIAEKSVLKS